MNIIATNVTDDHELSDRLIGFFFRENDSTETLYSEEKYSIQLSSDKRFESEFIELWGVMSSGDLIVMRSPVSSMKDSAQISSIFMAYIGLLAIGLSILIAFALARTITQPILKLVDISDRMANLDFDAKYEGNENNEIGVLGEHMNQLSETLEKTISELKAANNQLTLDLDRKNKDEEMRREFLSNVSHELKTPIALIQGYAEGLIDCVNDDEDSKDFYCEVIADEANKMNRLVRSLLELNELEYGQNKTTFERFDITELIRNCVNSFEILLKQNEIEYIFNQTEPIYIWSDIFKIEQVLNNFISNAIHYAEGEKKIIRISITKSDDKIKTEIFNSGKNIPEDEIDKVWDKFYKVDKARSREYGGSGVGLSIVKAAMESINQGYGIINYDDGVGFWFETDGSNV